VKVIVAGIVVVILILTLIFVYARKTLMTKTPPNQVISQKEGTVDSGQTKKLLEYDKKNLTKIAISNIPYKIIQAIDKDYIKVNGTSVAKEPISNAFAYKIDLNGDGKEEWVVAYSGADDLINEIYIVQWY